MGTDTIGVLGLGAVGLPLAVAFAAAGYPVVPVDRDDARVAAILAGRSPFRGEEPALAEALAATSLAATTDPAALAAVTTLFLAVETPAPGGVADLGPLEAALREGLRHAPRCARVVVESTIPPGTVRGRLRPLVDGIRPGVALAHCPERVMPGRLLANLREMPRVLGVEAPEDAPPLAALYAAIGATDVHVVPVTAAELIKTGENAARDVAIATANVLALACQAHGVDFPTVRREILRVPGRALLEGGAGVGGACLPKDTWLLAGALPEPAPLLAAARATNDGMPGALAAITEAALAAAGRPLPGAKVVVLGTGYLPGHGDERGSPGRAIASELLGRGAQVSLHDPYVAGLDAPLAEALTGADAAVLATAHAAYRAADWAALAPLFRTKVLIDGRYALPSGPLRAAGFVVDGFFTG